jgi:hypothetical protein
VFAGKAFGAAIGRLDGERGSKFRKALVHLVWSEIPGCGAHLAEAHRLNPELKPYKTF